MCTYIQTAKIDLEHLKGLLVNAKTKAQTVKLMGLINDLKQQIKKHEALHNVQ